MLDSFEKVQQKHDQCVDFINRLKRIKEKHCEEFINQVKWFNASFGFDRQFTTEKNSRFMVAENGPNCNPLWYCLLWIRSWMKTWAFGGNDTHFVSYSISANPLCLIEKCIQQNVFITMGNTLRFTSGHI